MEGSPLRLCGALLILAALAALPASARAAGSDTFDPSAGITETPTSTPTATPSPSPTPSPTPVIGRSTIYSAPIAIRSGGSATVRQSLADMDGDGDIDVISSFGDDGTAYWFENMDGRGTFGTMWLIASGASRAFCVSAADVDGDGDPDVILESVIDHKIAWHENFNGLGHTFLEHPISIESTYATAVVPADIDGDGDLDVAIWLYIGGKVGWYRNLDGKGTFSALNLVGTSIIQDGDLSLVDLDGDGDLDLLAASLVDNKIVWYRNTDGNGTFSSVMTITSTAEYSTAAYAVDLDGDSYNDVVCLPSNENLVSWFPNTDGHGTFATEVNLAPYLYAPEKVLATDLDKDGDPDLVIVVGGEQGVSWIPNNRNGTIGTPTSLVTIPTTITKELEIGDLDGDGDDDLVFSRTGGYIYWARNIGGQFALATVSTAPPIMAPGDYDDLLKITVTHKGRPGDYNVELANLALRFEGPDGQPMTTAQATALFSQIIFYGDNGSGAFENGLDTPITGTSNFTLTDGRLDLVMPDADLGLLVSRGTPKNYFLVAVIAPGAAAAGLSGFRVVHVAPESIGEARSDDTRLQEEDTTEVGTAVIALDVPPPPTPTPYDGLPFGDFDSSGCTDIADFLILLDNWEAEWNGIPIGISQFLSLLDYWQAGPQC